MKTFLVSILMSALVGFVVHKLTITMDYEDMQEILAENEALKVDNQYIEGQAYSDCQRMIQTNRKIDKVDGCMITIEKLCTQRVVKDTELCMRTFMPVCGHLED